MNPYEEDPVVRRRVRAGDADAAGPRPAKLSPGTRLLREWGGSMHEVIVLEHGVLYQGQRDRSLTVVATKITGAHSSGRASLA